MMLNDMIISGNNGGIYFTKENNNTIKLGEFKFRPEYKHVDIVIGDICKITYEGDNGEMSTLPNMYWVKSVGVCDRCHGFISRDDKWVDNLFEEVSPFTDEINCLLEEFFRKAFDRAQNMPGKQVV